MIAPLKVSKQLLAYLDWVLSKKNLKAMISEQENIIVHRPIKVNYK